MQNNSGNKNLKLFIQVGPKKRTDLNFKRGDFIVEGEKLSWEIAQDKIRNLFFSRVKKPYALKK